MNETRTDPLVDHETESRVLGSLLEAGFAGRHSSTQDEHQATARRLVAEMLAEVHDEQITHPAIRAGITAARRLAKLEQPIDLGTVAQAMRDVGSLDERAIQLTLITAAELAIGGVPSGPHWARRLRTLAARRWLRAEAAAVASSAHEKIDDAGFEATLRARLINATAKAGGGVEVLGGQEWLLRTWNQLEARADGKTVPGVLCGLGYFDQHGGLERREMTVIAGRPGGGKTALGLRLALGAAEHGANGLIISAEMATEDLGLRVLAGKSGVYTDRVRDPRRLEASDWPRLGQLMSDFEQRGVMDRLRIAAPEDAQLAQLEDMVIREHAIQPLDFILLDYLQLVRADARSREEEVAKVSKFSKRMAKHTGAAVVALAQLNREVEKRGNPIPLLSDLRDSGQIEQDAATIAFVSQFGERDDGNGVEGPFDDRRIVYVRKRRHGTPNVAFPLAFYGERGPWFEDMCTR